MDMSNQPPYNDSLDWDSLIPSKKHSKQPKKPAPKAPRQDRPSGDDNRNIWKKFITGVVEFPRSHPIIFNILLIILAGIIALWLISIFLRSWTHHGEEVRVPDVKELPLDMAISTLNRNGFSYEVVDSVYESKIRPGSVENQVPTGGSTVKPGRTVYLTIVARTPKTIVVPDFMNVSLRTAQASFEGLGIKNIHIEYIPSEYKDLVLGATSAGRELRRGEQIPLSSSVTLKVGAGLQTDEPDDEEYEDYYDGAGYSDDEAFDELPAISLTDE